MSAAAEGHQRVDGEARIELKRAADGTTVLADLFQRAPCRVLFPHVEAGEPMQSVLLTTSGGLTGGDRTHVAVRVGAQARATLTTQAAEKIYRALPLTGDALVRVDVQVGPESWVEWLAQETILFNGARLRRTFSADVAPSSRLLAVESIVFGRTAMGESFDTGMLHDAWRIRRDGRLAWADALHLQDDVSQLRTAAFGFGTSVACSTVLYVGPDATHQLAEARRLLEGCCVPAAATALQGLLLIRVMADDAAEMRAIIMKLVAGIRHSAAALPARLPRVWYC